MNEILVYAGFGLFVVVLTIGVFITLRAMTKPAYAEEFLTGLVFLFLAVLMAGAWTEPVGFKNERYDVCRKYESLAGWCDTPAAPSQGSE